MWNIKTTPEELRAGVSKLIIQEGYTINTIAKALGIAWITLHRFLIYDTKLQLSTHLKICNFLEKNLRGDL
jgi:hypothetical protein